MRSLSLPVRRGLRAAAILAATIALQAAALPAFAQEKKPLTLEDYARWSTVDEVSISRDGGWVTFAYDPNDGDATFHVRRLDDAATGLTATNGSDPRFSHDSRWLAYRVSPPEKETEKLRKQGMPVRRGLHLIDLSRIGEEDDARTELAEVASFAFSDDDRFLAVMKEAAGEGGGSGPGRPGGSRGGREEERNDDGPKGADLLVRELATGSTITLGNVTDYAYNETSTHLAYLVDAAGEEGNGVYLLELESGRMSGLDTSPTSYDGLSWSGDGSALAALKGQKPEGKEQRENALLVFGGIGGGDTEAIVYDPSGDETFPEGFVLSEYRTPAWSEDGRRIYLGIKEQRDELGEDDELEADVEVWHWKDEEIQSRQKIQARRDTRDTWESAFILDGRRFVRLADDTMRDIDFTDHPRFAVGSSDAAYRMVRDRPDNRDDYFRVDLDTGDRAAVAEGIVHEMGTSPDGRRLLFLRDEHVVAYDLESGEEVDLSERAGVDFVNREFDRPVEKPTHGVAGWSEDGDVVVLNAGFDVWAVPVMEGAAVNLSNGAGARDSIRFRVVDLEEDDEEGSPFPFGSREPPELDLDRPLLLSAYGERTKKSGFFRTREGEDPEELIWKDEMIAEGGFRSPAVRKAADADVVIFTRQTFERFPDWWVSDGDFDDPERVTDANPQQADYLWGRRVLVDYTDRRGNDLQATLTLPAGYQEGKRYPMLVYFYEKLSQRHHQYSQPRYDDRPHMSTYASNGYLVLMPDIIYDEGRPGTSALDDVTSAARKVIELGYADPERIGLQGHSWGGYESSFILTRTDMFAAVVTGAPLTNLVSMYLINYKRTGSANQGLIEWGQGRMGVSPWEDMALYHEQSPLHHAPDISTPFIILHGTEDGAVDWNQGLEFYNAARRLGKEVILLSYPGEPHHLDEEANQKDFQVRMKQFFDHHLKGAPAPTWLEEGVRWLDRKRVGPEG